ncbi:MAG: hypothetical protein QHH06_07135 [Clostridiales bacterium]|jgi:hypothetical protein|nr:hypothetical protein [Eubacteriales bacterium]MDH7566241.1 hypothetical protein [Clostridiales bacterium]
MESKRTGQITGKYGLRLFTAIFLTVVLWLFGAHTCAYGAQNINISIAAGFDGKCRLGGVNPVAVSVEGTGEDWEGTLTVVAEGRNYSHGIKIPKYCRKSFVFSIPFFKADSKISAGLESGGKAVAGADFSPEMLPENSVLIGILSDTPETFAYAAGIDLDALGGKKAHVVRLDKDFAYSGEELENFNFILVDDFDGTDLAAESGKTLERWIRRGNCLLVGAGQYAYKNMKGLFEDLTGPRSVGDGVIVPVPEGLENKTPEFVEEVLQKYATPYGISKIVGESGLTRQLREVEKLYPASDGRLRPTADALFFLLSLLALYLLAAGTALCLDKKLHWLFSAVVAGFCGIFYIAALWGGVQDTSAAAAAVKIHEKGNTSRRYTLTGVYPRGEGKISLKWPEASFLCNCGQDQGVEDPLEMESGFAGKGPHYAYGMGLEPSEAAVFKLDLDQGEVLTGKIKNPLPYKLCQCFLLLGDTVISLGDLEGREEVRVKYRLDHNLRSLSEYNFLDTISRTARMEEGQQLLFEHYYYGLEDGAPGGRLLGFADGTERVQVDGRARSIRSTVLHVFPAELNAPEGEVYFPCGYIAPVPDPGENTAPAGKKEYLPGQGEELPVYYVLPPDIRAEEIQFYGVPEKGAGTLEVFDRKQGSWRELEGNSLSGDSLDRCTAGGPLKIRITGASRVILPDISLKGAYDPKGEKGTAGGQS